MHTREQRPHLDPVAVAGKALEEGGLSRGHDSALGVTPKLKPHPKERRRLGGPQADGGGWDPTPPPSKSGGRDPPRPQRRAAAGLRRPKTVIPVPPPHRAEAPQKYSEIPVYGAGR